MKIGFTIDKFIIGPGLPGIDKVCFHLAQELSRTDGLEVFLFQDKYKDAGAFGIFPLLRFPSPRDLPFAKRFAGGDGSGRGGDSFSPPSRLLLFVKDVLKRRAIERSGIDVLHYPTHLERPYRLFSIPSVMTFHDLVPLLFRETCTPRVTWEMEESLKRLSRVDHFCADSGRTKEDMVNVLGVREDDITVVYPGISAIYRPVDAAGVRERVSGGKPYLLFLGTVEPRKNLPMLLEAFARIEEDLILLISGHMGWGVESVRRTVKELSLEERVKFTGFVPEEELPALYAGAELFVYPSLYEGFGLPPVEALACGVPVASSTGGSLPEVLGDAAAYFDPSDTDEMRHVIVSLLHDNQKRARLSARGLERAKSFTWRNCALGVVDVYKKLIA
jgi:alpha-1,3-rhamnosyl/mannosyltransferase